MALKREALLSAFVERALEAWLAMNGKAVIRGTRIPVEIIMRKLGEGATEADLLDAYPGLIIDDIHAALAYAAASLAHEAVLLKAG